VKVSEQKLREEATLFYQKPAYSVLRAWKETHSRTYDYSLVGRVKKSAVYRGYKLEFANKPHLGRTAFYEQCPKQWVNPSFEKCLCSHCHKGEDCLSKIEKLLQIGLPAEIRQSNRGYGIHTPKTTVEVEETRVQGSENSANNESHTLLYRNVVIALAKLRHHLTEEFLEKVYLTNIEGRMTNNKTTGPSGPTRLHKKFRKGKSATRNRV